MCSSIFPASFKLANITPVFKVGFRNQKDNYRPISIPPSIAKIFEKLISQQLWNYFQNFIVVSGKVLVLIIVFWSFINDWKIEKSSR